MRGVNRHVLIGAACGALIGSMILNVALQPSALAQAQGEGGQSVMATSPRAYLPVMLSNFIPDALISGELGMNPARYEQMKRDAAMGVYDRPCLPSEHDPNTWHALVDPVKKCHYNHHHGDDPSLVDDLFGPVGAWFGQPGRSIAYPWQTFPISDTETNPNVDKPANVKWENEAKHEGYIWIVRRNQMCAGGRNCVTDFRLQAHFMSSHDAPVRFHSFSAELRVCEDAIRKTGCGLIRTGGWMNYDKLFIPPASEDCWIGFNAAFEGRRPDLMQYIVRQGNWNQLFPASGLPGGDEHPFDEFRCHKMITPEQVRANPSGMRNAAEWWGHIPDLRFRILVWNPHANVGQNGLSTTPHCSPTDAVCRWTFSRFTVEFDYVVPVHESLDTNGDGIADARGFDNRVHWGPPPPGCTRATEKCVPYEYVGMRVGAYNHDLAPNQMPLDYDITPPGRPSWIQWFQPGNQIAHLNAEP